MSDISDVYSSTYGVDVQKGSRKTGKQTHASELLEG
jgi:hypothetical protein